MLLCGALSKSGYTWEETFRNPQWADATRLKTETGRPFLVNQSLVRTQQRRLNPGNTDAVCIIGQGQRRRYRAEHCDTPRPRERWWYNAATSHSFPPFLSLVVDFARSRTWLAISDAYMSLSQQQSEKNVVRKHGIQLRMLVCTDAKIKNEMENEIEVTILNHREHISNISACTQRLRHYERDEKEYHLSQKQRKKIENWIWTNCILLSLEFFFLHSPQKNSEFRFFYAGTAYDGVKC